VWRLDDSTPGEGMRMKVDSLRVGLQKGFRSKVGSG